MRYRIQGVDKDTGEPRMPMYLDTVDVEAALAEAVEAGMSVKAIDEAPVQTLAGQSDEPTPWEQMFDANQVADERYPWNRSTRRFLIVLWIVGIAAVFLAVLGLIDTRLFGEWSLDIVLPIVILVLAFGTLMIAQGLRILSNIARALHDIRDRLPPRE